MRLAWIASRERPSAVRSTSAWEPVRTPGAASGRTRSRQVDAELHELRELRARERCVLLGRLLSDPDLARAISDLEAPAAAERCAGNPIDARLHDPTVARFEAAPAELEHTDEVVASSSGTAALTAAPRRLRRARVPCPEPDGRRLRGPGATLSFEVEGGLEGAASVTHASELVTPAVSLGATDTLIRHPVRLSAHRLPEEETGEELGSTDGPLCLSVGLADVDDLWGDLVHALAAARVAAAVESPLRAGRGRPAR